MSKKKVNLTGHQMWGMQLLERLGQFVETVATGAGPYTTTIVAKFNDVEFPVIHIWATTDDKEPAARCAELAAARRALEVTVEQLRAELARVKGEAPPASPGDAGERDARGGENR